MNQTYMPFGWTDPRNAQRRQLKKDANFVGLIVLAILAAQLLISGILMLCSLAGVMDVHADCFGLPCPVYLLINMFMYVGYLMIPVLIVACGAHRFVNPFVAQKKVGFWSFAAAVCAGISLAILSNFLTNILVSIDTALGIPLPDTSPILDGSIPSLLIGIISIAILPGILEEMAFRGFILNALRPYGNSMAVIITAVLFGLLHGNIVQIPFAFMLGLVLGYVTVQSGSIYIAVVIHAANNCMSVLLEHFTLNMSDGNANRLALAVYAIIGVAGTIGWLTITLIRHFINNDKYPDLLRPMGNHAALLTVKQRVSGIIFSPAVLIFIILILLQTILSTVAGG